VKAAIMLSLRLLWAELRYPGAIGAVACTLAPSQRRGFARDLRLAGVPAVLLAVALWLWLPGAVACAVALWLWGLWAMHLADRVDA
jgi:hypothetical protein